MACIGMGWKLRRMQRKIGSRNLNQNNLYKIIFNKLINNIRQSSAACSGLGREDAPNSLRDLLLQGVERLVGCRDILLETEEKEWDEELSEGRMGGG
jgi:hypothetical protein